jgi:putative ABC transport system permease protein
VTDRSGRLDWATAWRLARRDLAARFRGLRLLLVCLFLGTAALSAIGTLTAAIENELEGRGQELLGGDVQASVWQREVTEEERAALASYGRLSSGVRLQAIARAGENVAPIELKSVDAAYPLYGTFTLADGREAGMPPPGEAYLAPGAGERLEVGVGDRFRIGTATLEVGGIIEREPDRLGEGFQLGPTVIVAEGVPQAAGLTAPGSMFETKMRIAFDTARDPQEVADAIEDRFPLSGFDLDTSERASPGADRFVGRMSEFLTLIGLAALVIAGIGIGGGVTSYLAARRTNIATLKILGATSADIARIYGLQIGVAALIGCGTGLAVGIAATPVLGAALSGLLPVDTGIVIDPVAILTALAYGLLVALLFSATPLARARRVPAMALMRARVAPLAADRRAAGYVVAALATIIALVLVTASRPLLSAGFILGAVLTLGLLALLGLAIRAFVGRLPRAPQPVLRNALANLTRPGANTTALVTALGFGLSAFVALAAIQTSIDGNIDSTVPERAPDYFVLDLPKDRLEAFETIVTRADPSADIRAVPNMRGSITAYGPAEAMTRVAELEEIPEGAWPLRGERGLTYSPTIPEGNRVTAGEWWTAAHSGEPLVSVDREFAEAIDLAIGDYLTVAVLGVERSARVASFREIDWDSLGFNFVLVFSPNALEDAPHNFSATIGLAETAEGGALLRELVDTFPSTSVIEIGQVLVEARQILSQVGIATFAAASVTVLAGLAVLLGAIAAARAARTYDTVILRVLGADRRQVLAMLLLEYGVLALLLSGVALLLGGAVAWGIITQLFEFDWLPDWGVVAAVLAGGIGVILAFALGGSLPVLRARPAQALRTL